MNDDYYKNCFAFCGGKCNALDRLYCKEKENVMCRFFKTKDERELSDALATISRIKRKYGGKS